MTVMGEETRNSKLENRLPGMSAALFPSFGSPSKVTGVSKATQFQMAAIASTLDTDQ
jgi:hypothetical protein